MKKTFLLPVKYVAACMGEYVKARALFILCLWLISFMTSQAQSIILADGSLCTGQQLQFVYGGNCAGNISWSFSGTQPSTYSTSGTYNQYLTATFSSPGSPIISANCAGSGYANYSFTMNATVAATVAITANTTNMCGIPVTFTATTNTTGTPTYSWYVNGVKQSTPSGASFTSGSLSNNSQVYATMAPDVTTCATSYTGATSNTITMTAVPQPSAVSIVSALPLVYCQGAPMTFTASVNSANLSPAYQWKVDGANAGTNNNQFTTSALAAGFRQLVCVITPANPCFSPSSSNSITTYIAGAPTLPGITTFLGAGSITVVVPSYPYLGQWDVRWYDDVPGNTYFLKYWTRTFSDEGTFNYQVCFYNNQTGCEGPRTPVSVTVYKQADPGGITGNPHPLRRGIYSYQATTTFTGYNYNWTVPGGVSILSGQGTPKIQVQVGTVSGTMLVQAANPYGPGLTASLDISISDISYVRDETIVIPGVFDAAAIPGLPVESRNSQTTYVDGLGRPVQTLAWQQSPMKKDMVQTINYDAYGRTPVSYLPYTATTNNGDYKISWATEQPQFYQGTSNVAIDNTPSALTVFEPSPLNRVWEQGAVGTAWQPADQTGNSAGYTVKISYMGNTTADGVRLWNYDYASGLCASTNIYADNYLHKNLTTDEHGNQSWEYKDKLGHTICKRTQDNNTLAGSYIETYNVYDDDGQLRIVIPPMGGITLSGSGWVMTQTLLDTWCYQYQYDERQRMIAKKIPGAGWVYVVYDQRDRPALIQDANQRVNNQYTYTKYDQLNRPVVTGLCTITGSITAIRTAVKNQTTYYETRTATGIGYTLNQTYPVNPDPTQALTVTFYDDYSFKGQTQWTPTATPAYDFIPELGNSANFTVLNNKATAVKIKVLNDNTWLKTVSYYDDRYRVIQSISDNYTAAGSGGIDRSTSRYDFAGRLLSTQLTHTGIENVSVNEYYYYDHAGRLLDLYHSVNGASQVHLASYSYNELGQLVEKGLQSPILPCMGSTVTITSFNSNCNAYVETQLVALLPGFSFVATPGNDFSATTGPASGISAQPLQSVDYRYNIRGWLTSINNSNLANDNGITNNDNNDLWGMELKYNTTTLGIGKPQFNGNIAEILWKGARSGNTSRYGFGYSYDPVNRLVAAGYAINSSGTWAANGNYNETFGYDKNGNMTSLVRYGLLGTTPTKLDDLSYVYNGNQRTRVDDNGDSQNGFTNKVSQTVEYNWDANGNMKTNLNKGINISYNLLNLPQAVSTVTGNNLAVYVYDAAGRKLATKTYQNGVLASTSTYIGGLVFKDNAIDYLPTAEGRVTKISNNNWNYEYFMKDHLGSVRMSFDKDPGTGTARIIQENAYYSFGGEMPGMSWIFGAENLLKYNGKEQQKQWNVTDYGARFKDDWDPSWGTPDPLADNYHPVGQYVYVLNNPISLIDPDGRQVVAKDKEAQQVFMNTLNELFGEGHGFSFNRKGKLSYSAKKDMNSSKEEGGYGEEQKSLFSAIKEVTENTNYTLDFSVQKGSDKNYSIEFRGLEMVTDANGKIAFDDNGKPILEEKVTNTVNITNKEEGGSGGGVTVAYGNYKNAGIIIFTDIASKKRFKSNVEGQETKGSTSVTVIHELLDHGLIFIRTGSLAGTFGNDVKNVSYQNQAFKIIGSPQRINHSHE